MRQAIILSIGQSSIDRCRVVRSTSSRLTLPLRRHYSEVGFLTAPPPYKIHGVRAVGNVWELTTILCPCVVMVGGPVPICYLYLSYRLFFSLPKDFSTPLSPYPILSFMTGRRRLAGPQRVIIRDTITPPVSTTPPRYRLAGPIMPSFRNLSILLGTSRTVSR